MKGKKQELKTGSKQMMPDQYRCTITCAVCAHRKHYEDECYHGQRTSTKLKYDVPQGDNGGGGKSKGKGKGKSKGNGKGQCTGQGRRGGPPNNSE